MSEHIEDTIEKLQDVIYESKCNNAEMVGILEILKFDLMADARGDEGKINFLENLSEN